MEKKKILKIVLITILILFIFFILCTTRKFIVLSNLINKAKEFSNKTNYIAIVQSLQNGNVNIMKSYNKDGNYLSILDTYSKDFETERGLTVYNKDNEKIGIIKSNNEKIVILNGSALVGEAQVVNTLSVIDNQMSKIQLAIMSKITVEDCDGKVCYFIQLDGWKMWIDKETGLIVREINGEMVTERFYEFDVVKDEDITKPDVSDCKIQ